MIYHFFTLIIKPWYTKITYSITNPFSILCNQIISDFHFQNIWNKSRVPDQYGLSQLFYIVEIYHSGQKPLNCMFDTSAVPD